MHDLWNYVLKEKYFWNIMVHRLCICSVRIMVCYDTKVFWYRSNLGSQSNYVSVDPTKRIILGIQWILSVKIVRWYLVDPTSGGCALVFSEFRQWGLNIGYSRGCWVMSVLIRIEFVIILYINIWKDWIYIELSWNIFLYLFIVLFLKII